MFAPAVAVSGRSCAGPNPRAGAGRGTPGRGRLEAFHGELGEECGGKQVGARRNRGPAQCVRSAAKWEPDK